MPTLIGPSHHLFYGGLHRRRLWLSHLGAEFTKLATPGWNEARTRLDASFSRSLKRLTLGDHLGILHPLPLQRVIDDTPVDSFLTTLADELEAYEHNLFDLILSHAPKLEWRPALEEISMLWGRELAQESRMALLAANAPENVRPVPEGGSLRGISILFYSVLDGGDFSGKPLLVRRRTDTEVQYELRNCPHRKPTASKESADLACLLDSRVYQGFAQSYFENAGFQRRTCPGYCVDELWLTPR